MLLDNPKTIYSFLAGTCFNNCKGCNFSEQDRNAIVNQWK